MRRRALILVLDGLAIGLLFVALTLLVLRLLLPQWEGLSARVESYLSAATGRDVTFDSLQLGWSGWAPELVARGARISVPDGAPLLTQELGVSLDLRRSLRAKQPRLQQLRLSGVALQLHRECDGSLMFHGWRIPRRADQGLVWEHLRLGPASLRVERVSVFWLDQVSDIGSGLLLDRLDLRQDESGWRLRAHGAMLPEAGGEIVLGLEAPTTVRGDARVYLELRDLQLDYWLRQFLPEVVHEAADDGAAAGDLPGTVTLKLWAGLSKGHFTWLQGEHETWFQLPQQGGTETRLKHHFRWQSESEPGQLKTGQAAPGQAWTEWVGMVPGAGTWRLNYPLPAADGHVLSAVDGHVLPLADESALSAADTVGLESASAYQLMAKDVDLALYTQVASILALFDEPISRHWLLRDPKGTLDFLSWRADSGDFPGSTDLIVAGHDLGFSAVGEWPGVTGFSGRLGWQRDRGTIAIAGTGLRVDLPLILPGALTLETVTAELGVANDAEQWTLSVDRFAAANRDLSLVGSGRFNYSAGVPWLDLNLDFLRADAARVEPYLPHRWLTPEFRDWLSAGIQAGKVTGGGMTLRGDPRDFPFAANQGLFEVTVAVVDGQLDYQPGWPVAHDLSGTLLFRNDTFAALNVSGRLLDAEVTGASFTMAPIGDAQPLLIRGQAHGPAADLVAYLAGAGYAPGSDTPWAALPDVTDGRFALDLDLVLPLQDGRGLSALGAKGSLELFDVNWVAKEDFVSLQDLSGRVSFTSSTGFRAEEFTLQVAGEAVRGSVSGDLAGQIQLQARGKQPLEPWFELLGWDPSRLLNGVSGQAVWDLDLQWAGPGHSQLRLRSDLEGLQVHGPAPLNKTRGVRRDFELTWPLRVTQLSQAQLRIQDWLKVDWRVAPDAAGDGLGAVLARPLSMRMVLGDAPSSALPLPLAGSVVQVNLATADLAAWSRFLGPIFAPIPDLPADADSDMTQKDRFAGIPQGGLPLQLDLRVREQLRWQDQVLSGVHLRMEWQEDTPPWIWLDSDWLAGEARLLPGADADNSAARTLGVVNLQRLHLEQWGPRRDTGRDSARAQVLPDFADWPPLSVTITDLIWNTANLRNMQLSLDPAPGRVGFNARGQVGVATELTATGAWETHDSAAGATSMTVALAGSDWGEALSALGLSESLSGGEGQMQIELNWPGLPWDFAVAELQGELDLALRDGHLLDLEPGAGRVLGLFSLDLIPQRLRLDFRDVYSAGFGYDQMTARATVSGGDLWVSDLTITGRSAVVRMAGRTGLLNRDLDQHVVVVPRLRSTLPIVGALVGGPVAGAVVLVVERVLGIGDQVEEAARVEYKISGSWSNPVVRAQVRVGGDGVE